MLNDPASMNSQFPDSRSQYPDERNPKSSPGLENNTSPSNSSFSSSSFSGTNGQENSPFKPIEMPSISLPQGGGAIQGIGEKFQANPVTGTGSMTVPIAVSPGRGGFGPQLGLSYDSGAGNSPFGMGWKYLRLLQQVTGT